MNYHLLDDPEQLHDTFRRRFTLPYGAFCHAHAQRLASLPKEFRIGYTSAYYDRLPYSDRLISGFETLAFSDALCQLEQLGSVIFLTNPSGGLMRDYNPLGTETLWAARAEGTDLAATIRGEWFRQYALWDQGMCDPDQLFGSELFAFTDDLRRCIVFTHETDETERPETRVCLSFSDRDRFFAISPAFVLDNRQIQCYSGYKSFKGDTTMSIRFNYWNDMPMSVNGSDRAGLTLSYPEAA